MPQPPDDPPAPAPPDDRSAREQLENLLHTMPDQVWFKDLQGRYLLVNDAYAEARGIPRERIEGRTDFDLFPGDVAERFRAADARVLREGKRIAFETAMVEPDGSIAWFEEAKAPLRHRSGEVVGTVGISRDITQRKRSQVFYQVLVETAPYGIYATDLAGCLTLANPALGEILDLPPERLVGRFFLDFVAPEDRELASARFRERASGLVGARDFEIRALRADGEVRLLHVRSAEIRIEGVHVGSQGAVRDITELREREMALRRAERLASTATLIAGVAHELNNPLTAIRSFAQLLLMDPRSPDDQEALETVLREADRAAGIVASLRMLARDPGPGQDEARQPTALNALVRSVLRSRRASLEAAGAEIVLELASDVPPVLCERGQLEQVVLNLLANAEQALVLAPGPRRLAVRTRAAEGRIWLTVSDTGPGIPEEHLPRIFDPFFTTRPPGAGVGLGLSLVHRVVAELDGEVRVESEHGEGATFHVILPAVLQAAASISPRATRGAAPARPLRVLVVDDEEPIRFSVSHFLARRGHSVEVARDGEEALRRIDEAAARGDAIDVILSDVRMPRLDGEQLLARLRERGEGLDRRLIFMSGDAASASAARERTGREVPVVNKPFELLQVALLVEERAEQPLDTPGPSG